MRYLSTRGESPPLAFDEVLLSGPARDGGLYLPESWPRLTQQELSDLAGLPYPELAARVMRPFIAGSVAEARFDLLVAEACAAFDHAAVVPLKQLETSLWLLELFHGPTLAFKDVALQLLGLLFEEVLKERRRRVTVVGATSGDTGSAAIEGCRGRELIEIFILHPKDRITEVQRRQMTTVPDENVHSIAIEGTFDDCQDLVKGLFADRSLAEELGLAAVNSINWGRIMAQIAYYVAAAVALGAPLRQVAFAVPSGNFGNAFAGYAAYRMGLPLAELIVATNRNDILARLLASGEMRMEGVVPSLSPSMDIQVSSNFERLLHELLEGDGRAVAEALAGFRRSGAFRLPADAWRELRRLFTGFSLDDPGTLAEIRRRQAESGELLDPHSAIATASAQARRSSARVPLVALATAHPAKFPDAVEQATGLRPALPPRLSDLFARPERSLVLPNDLAMLKSHISTETRRRGAAA